MSRTRKLFATLLAGGAVAAASLAVSATPAHAAIEGCSDTVGSFVVFADRNGAAYTLNNVLQSADATRCYYEGELWYAAGGNGNNYQGQYTFSRARR